MGLLVLAIFLVNQYARAVSIFPSQYDAQIESAVKLYWIDYPDWLSWKAQLYQESKLDPNAESSVGAQGLAQIMPKTWIDISRALGYGTISRKLAGPAILGGAYYMAGLRRSWRSPRPMDDRQRIAEASFNAGSWSLLKAQKLCNDAVLWADISPCLIQVTGPAFSNQTITYVRMIAKWRSMMR